MIAASAIFIVLIGISMTLYPGGNLIDRTSIHFNFFLNFFSDLGSSQTESGKQNTSSQVFFIIAMGMFGLVMIYYSRIWRGMDLEVHDYFLAGILSKILFAVSGLCFIGMAFTPWNVKFEVHVLLYKVSVMCFLGWLLIMVFLQRRNEKIRNVFVINSLVAVAFAFYVYYIFFDHAFGKAPNIEFHAITQKIIMLLIPAELLFQSVGIMHFLRRADFRRSSRKDFYV